MILQNYFGRANITDVATISSTGKIGCPLLAHIHLYLSVVGLKRDHSLLPNGIIETRAAFVGKLPRAV